MAAAQAAEAGAAGAVSAALLSFGLSPELLFMAVLGCGAFLLLSSSMHRAKALACFLFAAPLGAIVGHAAGARWFDGNADAMKLASFLAAAVAVPVLRGLLVMLDGRSADLWGAAADRALGRKEDGK